MRQSCLLTMLRIKSLEYPHGYQLLGDVGMLTKARVDTTQLLVMSTHGTSTPVCLHWHLLIQVLPVVELQMLQRPVIAALLAQASIRPEPHAIYHDQILLEQHINHLVWRDAALELIENILAARVREDVLGAHQLRERLGRGLSILHDVLIEEITSKTAIHICGMDYI